MGIYIDSIIIPDSCDNCLFNYDDLYCLITEEKVAFQKRKKNCPLKEIKIEQLIEDTISRQDVKWQIQQWINELKEAIDMLDSITSAEPLVLTCDGCRHVGTYDTDFPCSGCIRREKDYYEQER